LPLRFSAKFFRACGRGAIRIPLKIRVDVGDQCRVILLAQMNRGEQAIDDRLPRRDGLGCFRSSQSDGRVIAGKLQFPEFELPRPGERIGCEAKAEERFEASELLVTCEIPGVERRTIYNISRPRTKSTRPIDHLRTDVQATTAFCGDCTLREGDARAKFACAVENFGRVRMR
jgi:hypothetical protein